MSLEGRGNEAVALRWQPGSCRTSCVAAGINLWAQNKMVYSVFMSLGRLPDHSEEAAQSWDTYLVRKITDIWRRDNKKQRRVVET